MSDLINQDVACISRVLYRQHHCDAKATVGTLDDDMLTIRHHIRWLQHTRGRVNMHIQLASLIVCSRYEGIADSRRTIHIVQMGMCYVSWRWEGVHGHIAVVTEAYSRAAVCKAFSGNPQKQLGFDAVCVGVPCADAEGCVRMSVAVVLQLDVVSKMNITLSGVGVEPRPRR
jgi:hypothetical protein